jgi:hypothetical protein
LLDNKGKQSTYPCLRSPCATLESTTCRQDELQHTGRVAGVGVSGALSEFGGRPFNRPRLGGPYRLGTGPDTAGPAPTDGSGQIRLGRLRRVQPSVIRTCAGGESGSAGCRWMSCLCPCGGALWEWWVEGVLTAVGSSTDFPPEVCVVNCPSRMAACRSLHRKEGSVGSMRRACGTVLFNNAAKVRPVLTPTSRNSWKVARHQQQ